MRVLFAYDSEVAAGQWLSDFIAQHEPVVAILSNYVSPSSAIDTSEFRFGNAGEIVVIDIAHAHDDFIDKSFDEMVYISGQIGGAMPPGVFDGFSAKDVSFIPLARKPRGIKKEHIKGKRAASVSAGFNWEGYVFQTRPDDLTLITGRATKICSLRSLGQDHPDFMWRTEDNQAYQFTATEFLRFAIAIDEHVEAQFVNSWSKQ